MATNTILLGNFTNCSAIAFESRDISQVWYTNSLVWSAGTSGTPATSAWVSFPSTNTVAASYTPISNQYLLSASMIIDDTQGFNFLNGVWLYSSASNAGIKTEVYETQNVAPVNVGTVNSKTAWKHTHKFAGTTMLSAGQTYLFHIGYNYFDVQYLNGNYAPRWAANWSFATANSQTQSLTSASIETSGIYLELVTSGA